MSIVLKSDEVNYVVYKYLMQTGLTHTAFSMFYQANLEAPAKQFRYDVQAGYLVTLLERALLLTQIESHVFLNEYQQCKQPVHLLKPHTCEITERNRDLAHKMERLNDNINESIKRTNDIFSNQFRSDKFVPQPVVIEPRADFIDNFSKVKLRKKLDLGSLTFCEETKTVAINEQEDNRLIFLQYAGGFETVAIIPTFLNDSFSKVLTVLQTSLYSCLCFEGNNFVILGDDYSVRTIFQLDEPSKIVSMVENHNNPELACFQFQNIAHIMNLHTFRTVRRIPCQQFLWRYHDEYVVADRNTLALKKLDGSNIIEFNIQEPVEFMMLSESKQYLLTVFRNTVKIFTFVNSEALLIFSEDCRIIRSLLATSKSVNYLLILTDTSLKIWDIELSSFKRQILLGQRLSQMVVVNQQNEQDSKSFLVCLADTHLTIYDISQNRDETIAIQNDQDSNLPTTQDVSTIMIQRSDNPKLKQLSMNESVLLVNNTLYMLEASIIKDVFQEKG